MVEDYAIQQAKAVKEANLAGVTKEGRVVLTRSDLYVIVVDPTSNRLVTAENISDEKTFKLKLHAVYNSNVVKDEEEGAKLIGLVGVNGVDLLTDSETTLMGEDPAGTIGANCLFSVCFGGDLKEKTKAKVILADPEVHSLAERAFE
jgi:hypothetical protein